jgi:iron complex outermembrane receptor protein
MRKTFIAWLFLAMPLATLAQSDSLGKLLDLSLEELMNIKVVTASGYMQSVIEAPSTITVITAQQIADRGYEQLEDALRDIPGIDMIHINGYAPTLIYFRGMYGAENLRALLMIDGIVENNILGSNDMAGPAYSLHNAERVEIIWGPVSALYGANAFGGVINIITKKGGDIDGLKVEQGFGSFNTIFSKLSMGMRKGKWEFSAAGTLYSTDGPKFSNRDPSYAGSYVDKAYSFNGAISYYTKKTITTLGYRVYNTPMGWGTYSNSPTVYFGLPSQGNNNLGVIGVVQRDFRGERSGLDESYLRTWSIQHDYKPSEKLNIMARLIYRETGISEDSYIYITTNGTRMIRARIATYSNRAGGDLTANYMISANHRLSGGIQYSQDNVEQGSRRATFDLNTIYLINGHDTVVNVNSTFLTRLYDIRNNMGGFLQYFLGTKLLGKTDFTAGVRYDRNSYFGDALSPRLAMVVQPAKKLILKFQFGKAFRAPSNLEIHQTPPSGGFKLKKERLSTFEINTIYTASKNFRIQLNGFRNELKDVIILGNLSGFTPDKNPAEHTVNGLELSTNLAFSKNFSAFANFTFLDAHARNLVTGTSGLIPGIAKLKGNIGAMVILADLLHISASGNWVGERRNQLTNPHGPVKGYFLTNFVISTGSLFKSRITASLNVHNIFNVKWLDPGFRTADGNLYATVLEQPGINGLFKISISL